jgi:hypothetical protein
MVVVEAVGESAATVVYATSSGPQRDVNMESERYTDAKIAGDNLIIDRGRGRTITLFRAADGRSLSVKYTLPDAPSFSGTLARSN